MSRTGFVVLLALSLTRVAGAQLKSAALPLLDADGLRALAPSIKSIRAEPGAISLRVGQTVQLATITVIAVDSAGKDRARLNGFDFGIKPGGPAEAVPRKITGVRAGTTELTIHYPTTAWKVRADPRPAATVKIQVKP